MLYWKVTFWCTVVYRCTDVHFLFIVCLFNYKTVQIHINTQTNEKICTFPSDWKISVFLLLLKFVSNDKGYDYKRTAPISTQEKKIV